MACPTPTTPPRRQRYRRTAGRILLAAAAVAGLQGGHALGAGFTQNELQVSPQFDLIDPEFSQARGRITWVDSTGSLWVASVDPKTGMFKPADGKGVLVDADAMTTADIKQVANGPEWVTINGADQIVYTKFLPGQPHYLQTARLALAAQSASGAWGFGFLGNQPRNGPYASTDAADPAPRITYIDPDGNHYWRDVASAATETLVPWFPASYYISMRFVRGARAVVFRAPVNGSNEVFRYWLDTQAVEQLTFDSGHDNIHSAAWMWPAPEYGGEFLLAVIADNDRELRVYRQRDKNSPVWSVIQRAAQPEGGTLSSLEPFTFNGKSYLFASAAVPPNDYPTRIFLGNVEPLHPVFRQLTPDLPLRARRDPEVFVTQSGPYIYFNRADRSLAAPGQPPGDCLACSEGVFRSATGLGAPLPP